MDGVVLGMAHRGRLNVLANIVGKSYDQIFREFEGYVDPNSVQGSGDVKYHLGATGKYVSPSRQGRHASSWPPTPATSRPSTRSCSAWCGPARTRSNRRLSYPVLPLLIHGDAAFAGQGVVAECLAMSEISGYRVGGTVHLVINNQIGFTTAPEYARSSQYATDVAKMIQAPIFHVNGDDPEACVRVAPARLRVPPDVPQGRRHRHGLLPPPRPQRGRRPQLHAAPDVQGDRRPPQRPQALHRGARARGDITLDEAEAALADFQQRLQVALDETRRPSHRRSRRPGRRRPWACCPTSRPAWNGRRWTASSTTSPQYPADFTAHPKLVRQFDARAKLYHEEGEVEWATAEALAFGSLLLEGTDVRLAGEDTRRGTFSQRHAGLVDYDNGKTWMPLADLPGKQAQFWVYDSLLSEYAAVGFEYGYSVANKEALVLWEAQFGDFVNGAQVVIDQYLVAAEDKWGQTSGLVLLLPHGYEGQGPEHSLGAHRALPHAVGRGQHPGRATPPPRPSTSTCSAGRCCATSASRWWSSRRSSRCA